MESDVNECGRCLAFSSRCWLSSAVLSSPCAEPDRAVVSSRSNCIQRETLYLPLLPSSQPPRSPGAVRLRDSFFRLFGLRLDNSTIASTGVQSDA